MIQHDLDYPFAALSEELVYARIRFPSNDRLFEALIEEVGEVARAVLEKKYDHARREALQVACVAMRLVTEGNKNWE